MKKERTVKPDGRYLIYYSFERAELAPPAKRETRPPTTDSRRRGRRKR